MNALICAALMSLSALNAHAQILSLRPLTTAGQTVLHPPIEGLWDSMRIAADGAGGYHIQDDDGGPKIPFRLMLLAGEMIADITAIGADNDGTEWPVIPVHLFVRVRVEGEQLQVGFLGSDALEERITRSNAPAHLRLDDGEILLLTASAPELQEFVRACLNRPEDFAFSITLERAGPVEQARDLNRQSWEEVSRPGYLREYAAAAAQAREAVALVPDEPKYWNTLGAACFRTGAFDEGLGAIARAEQLRSSPDPDDLAFRAMLNHGMGRVAEANAALLDLRRMLAGRRYRVDVERLRLLKEAEDLIDPEER